MCELSWSLYVKYLFDRVAAAGLLIVTSPLFAVVAVGLRLQGHDVFFAQERVGQHGGTLRVLKFTTMPTGSEELGYLTPAGDRRPFRLGRILRRTKLNELPQLINVIRGEMSLVGPRPMIRGHLAESLSEREISAYYRMRPGITGAASVRYADEDRILAVQADRDAYFREIILPHKMALEAEYARERSFLTDVRLLIHTLGATVRQIGARRPEV